VPNKNCAFRCTKQKTTEIGTTWSDQEEKTMRFLGSYSHRFFFFFPSRLKYILMLKSVYQSTFKSHTNKFFMLIKFEPLTLWRQIQPSIIESTVYYQSFFRMILFLCILLINHIYQLLRLIRNTWWLYSPKLTNKLFVTTNFVNLEAAWYSEFFSFAILRFLNFVFVAWIVFDAFAWG